MDKVKRNLQNALKLSGFSLRKEFAALIVDKFKEENIDLSVKNTFDSYVKKLCNSFETQCISEKSIEMGNVQRAIESCLSSGCDKHETIFNVLNAFDFPRFAYDPDRRTYFQYKKKVELLSGADSKAQLFLERYNTILQRTRRNFTQKLTNEKDQLKLQTVDYLLTLSYVTLDKILILGSLIQASDGKYCLEDPTGMVDLNLKHAKFHGGYFVENIIVLVNGYYEDKTLHVSTMILPPGEEYADSRPTFGNLNYFGGISNTPLRDSMRLKEHLLSNPEDMLLFFSNVWLDNPNIFERLEKLFKGFHATPPVAFVFMGDFLSESHGSEDLSELKKLFKQLGELIGQFPNLVSNSKFIFVPGMLDPCTPHIVPRTALPKFVTEDFLKVVPEAIFATNPCRIQYCTKEIVVFRADILTKLLQGTIHKPKKEELSDCLARTIVSQGHLSPMSLNSLTVHWDYDYTLRLYPLPDLVVIGDKFETYKSKYKGCEVINPGSFCDNGFQFKCYTPASNSVDDCILDDL